jgi:hypothetical protein
LFANTQKWIRAMSTTPFVPSSANRRSVFEEAFPVDDFALEAAERRLFSALNRRGVRYLLVGMSAALLEGAPVATQDLDLWFENTMDSRIQEAARDAGGFWISGFGQQPPAFGGSGLERIDVVLTAHGLEPFAIEYDAALAYDVEGVTIRALSLDRILASKRATNRPKDRAQVPVLEATALARKAEKSE